jgi:hypothetical protein
MSRAARIALFAGVLALIILAGAASLIVSQTKVSPDAIHSSVIRSEAGVDKAWKLPAASTFRRTLDELGELARLKSNRTVTVLRDLSPEQFQQHLRRANETGRRYIINFSRKEIFGAGAGHHSPIGGYLEAEDLVFVLDVNRDYQPWLIERARLFAAMDTWDGKKKRGLLLIE